MNAIARTTILGGLATATFLTIGCSSPSEEPNATAESSKPSAATKDNLAKGLADVQSKADANAAKLKADLAAALNQQRSELMSQFEANTSELTSQFGDLKKKVDSLKNVLPDEVKKAVLAQIPDLESSIAKLKGMIAKFDPKTMEELEAFKAKYQTEYDTALKLIKETSKLLEASGVKAPKLF